MLQYYFISLVFVHSVSLAIETPAPPPECCQPDNKMVELVRVPCSAIETVGLLHKGSSAASYKNCGTHSRVLAFGQTNDETSAKVFPS